MLRVIVAGGRGFSDYALMKEQLDYFLQNALPNVIIVSGKAKGADTMGERYATEHGLLVVEFPADWKNVDVPGALVNRNQYGVYNVRAGHIRNDKMAKFATEHNKGLLVAFWDGKSAGTANMIGIANKHGLQVRIVYWK